MAGRPRPQFIRSLGHDDDRLRLHFFRHTDPNGMDVSSPASITLEHTLCVVIRNPAGPPRRARHVRSRRRLSKGRLDFARNVVAVTGAGSTLDGIAERNGWLARFPMWIG